MVSDNTAPLKTDHKSKLTAWVTTDLTIDITAKKTTDPETSGNKPKVSSAVPDIGRPGEISRYGILHSDINKLRREKFLIRLRIESESLRPSLLAKKQKHHICA
jgi:hypothetical protein